MPESVPVSLIACRMLEDEVRFACAATGFSGKVFWVERGLHTAPHRLKAAVEAHLAELAEPAAVLLAMARCGNALAGLCTRHTLVLPRFADCAHMLRSFFPGDDGRLEMGALYLTAGWLRGERSFLQEYRAFASSSGEAAAKEVYARLMDGYHTLYMTNTGAYDMATAMPVARKTAAALGLTCAATGGTTRVLEKMMRGQWDEEFLVVRPGESVVF